MAGRGSGNGRRAAEILLVALVVGAPLAVGSVHAEVRAVLALVVGLALALMLGDRRAHGGKVAITVPLAALGFALVASLVQLVPLPRALLGFLSPRADETFAATVGDAGWRPITLDVAATVSEAGKLALYGAFFVAASVYCSRPRRRRLLLLAVVSVASFATLLGFLQTIAGTARVWFFYQPRAQILNELFVRGPFVNPNHFGALLALAAPIALVWGLREPYHRWRAFGAVVLLNVGIIGSMSRGALLGGLVAQVVAFLLERRLTSGTRTPLSGPRVALIVGGAIGASVLALVGLLAVLQRTHPGIGALTDTSGKRYVWVRALRLAWAYPWTGVGRGAFEQAFTRATDVGGHIHHQFAENAVIEALVAWGFPATILLVLLAILGARLCLRRADRDTLGAGAVAALAGLAVHETADFALELPGVALPALAIVASLFGARSSEEQLPAQRRVAVTWPWVAAPLAPIVLIVVAFLLPSAESDAHRLAVLADDPRVSMDQFLREAEAARYRHPADFRIPAVVANKLASARHPQTLRWLNDTLFLNPSHQSAHLLAAEVLAVAGRRDQALLEYRAAAEGATPMPSRVWDRAAARFPHVEDLLRAAPPNIEGHLGLVDWLYAKARWADALVVLARARAIDPNDLRPLRMEVAVSLRAGAPSSLDFASELAQRAPSEDARRLVAEAQLVRHDLVEAGNTLDLLASHGEERLELELRLVTALIEASLIDAARHRLDKLTWSLQRADRARVHEARAALERRAGNEHQAQWELDQARRMRGL